MTDYWDSREDADIQVITVVGTFPLTAPSSGFPPNGFFGFTGVGLKTLATPGRAGRAPAIPIVIETAVIN